MHYVHNSGNQGFLYILHKYLSMNQLRIALQKCSFDTDVSLESTNLRTLLQFCTGCSKIPVMAFHQSDTVAVYSTSMFPNTATCAMILELPRQVDNQEEFTTNMNAVLNMQKNGFVVV